MNGDDADLTESDRASAGSDDEWSFGPNQSRAGGEIGCVDAFLATRFDIRAPENQ